MQTNTQAELRGTEAVPAEKTADAAAAQPAQQPAQETKEKSNAFAEFLGVLQGINSISRVTAMNIPALAGGIKFITEQAAAVPFELYRRTDNGLEKLPGDPRCRALNYDTGDLLSNTEMLEGLYRDYLLDGNGYLYINRHGNELESLHYVQCSQVAVTVDPDPIFKRGHILVYGKTYRPWEFVRLCRNTADGMHGTGILQENSKMLSLAWATLVMQNAMMRGGGNARGFLTSERTLTKPQMDELKNGFASLYTAEGNGVVVLNKGLEFKQSSSTAVEMQLQEIVQQNRQELLLMLGVPYEVMLGKGTEDQFNAAIQRAVVPVLSAMETALNRDLLLESEKPYLVWKADTTELTKGATKQRYEAYKLAAEGGWISKNEIRRRENLPRVEGLDVIGMNLADVLFDMNTGSFYTPNTGSVMGADEGKTSPAPALPPDPAEEPETEPGKTEDPSLQKTQMRDTLEGRSHGYKRDDKGRFAYDGGRKKRRKTKYAPSAQANKSAIKVGPKKFGVLRGVFNTNYPNAQKGETHIISDGKSLYAAESDGNGSVSLLRKMPIDGEC